MQRITARRRGIYNKYYILMSAITIAYLVKTYLFYALTAKTSKKLHKLTFLNVLKAKLAFFDDNLLGNILNRFSKDFAATDEYLPIIFDMLLQVLKLILCCLLYGSINIFDFSTYLCVWDPSY